MTPLADSSSTATYNGHLDIYAVGMCSLCLIHCILLPLVGTLLPIAGIAAEDEFIHRLLVVMAAPATLWLVFKVAMDKPNSAFVFIALSGLSMIMLAAFVEALSLYEVPLTLVGASVLGVAHLQRWIKGRRFRRSHLQI